MIRPAVAASRAAFGISAVSNLLIVTSYDLAFTGFWDRLLFVIGMSSLAALMAGTIVALIESSCGRWSKVPSRCRSRTRSISVAVIIGAGLGVWADTFLDGSPRILGLGTALTLAVLIPLASKPVSDQQEADQKVGGVSWWKLLTLLLLLCWPLAKVVQPRNSPWSKELTLSGAAAGQRLPRETNLLLLVVDTLRGDHLGFEGYERDTSPTIDRLARLGVAFGGTTAQATRTSPSMASLMTATTPLTHGIIESRSVMEPELQTLGRILQAAGYQNAAIVANPMVGVDFGYSQGYSVFDEIYRESSEPIDAEAVVDRAIDWLEDQSVEPFALWLHFVDPHTPYDPPDPWRSEYFGDPLHESQPAQELRVGGRFGAMPPSARVDGFSTLRDYIALYDAEIRYTDAEIGRLLDYLQQRDLLQRTLVVLTSDHGESLGDHDYFFSHGAYSYESTSRVPLVFHHPQLVEPDRPLRVPRLIDVLPSIVELLGLTPEPQFEGVSLFSRTDSEGREAVAPIWSGSLDHTNLAVRTDKAKLILVPRHWRAFDIAARWQLAVWPTRASRFPSLDRAFRREVYDLSVDPGETVNLAGELPGTEDFLLDALLDWIASGASGNLTAEQRSGEDLDREVERQLEALGYVE